MIWTIFKEARLLRRITPLRARCKVNRQQTPLVRFAGPETLGSKLLAVDGESRWLVIHQALKGEATE